MFKKKLLLGIIPILGIVSLGSINFYPSETPYEPVLAEEATFEEENEPGLIEDAVSNLDDNATKYATFVVNKVQRNNDKVVDKLVDTYVLSQSDANAVIKNAKKVIKKSGARGNDYTSEATIKLLRDCEFDFSDFDVGRVVLDLNGFTFKLTYGTSWDFHESLVIHGHNGKIISSRGQSGAFELLDKPKKLSVNDVTFENFNCHRYPIFQVKGNAKKDAAPSVEFSNCTFKSCKSWRYGGVIYTYNQLRISFNKCNFEKCKSKYGGVAYIEKPYGSEVAFESCNFTECSAGEDGGVIYFQGNERIGEFYRGINALFRDCKAYKCEAFNGGFAYINSKAVDIDFANQKMEDCHCVEKGGCIYIDDEAAAIYNVEFVRSVANYGGAIYVGDKNATIGYCIFDQCRSRWNKGNAIYGKYGYKSVINMFINGGERDAGGGNGAVFIEESVIESVETPSNSPIWIFGGITLALIIGGTLTICLVFKKKKRIGV